MIDLKKAMKILAPGAPHIEVGRQLWPGKEDSYIGHRFSMLFNKRPHYNLETDELVRLSAIFQVTLEELLTKYKIKDGSKNGPGKNGRNKKRRDREIR